MLVLSIPFEYIASNGLTHREAFVESQFLYTLARGPLQMIMQHQRCLQPTN